MPNIIFELGLKKGQDFSMWVRGATWAVKGNSMGKGTEAEILGVSAPVRSSACCFTSRCSRDAAGPGSRPATHTRNPT